jgi:hypothetical protein
MSALGIGARVRCPADRGAPAYCGTVRDVGERREHMGRAFRWVVVERDGAGSRHIWPDHRLTVI